ncbi:hypothetical protein ACFE04_011439 [Oxalis oulophora]
MQAPTTGIVILYTLFYPASDRTADETFDPGLGLLTSIRDGGSNDCNNESISEETGYLLVSILAIHSTSSYGLYRQFDREQTTSPGKEVHDPWAFYLLSLFIDRLMGRGWLAGKALDLSYSRQALESPRILILMSIGVSHFFPLSGCSIYTSVPQSYLLMPGERSLSYKTSNLLRYLFGCPKFPLPVVSCRSPSFESGSPAGSASREAPRASYIPTFS